MKLPAIRMKKVNVTSINVVDRDHEGKYVIGINLKEPIKRIYGTMDQPDEIKPFPASGEMTKMILEGKESPKPPKRKRRVAYNVKTIKMHEAIVRLEDIDYNEKTKIIQWPSYYMLDVSRKGEVWLTRTSFKDSTITRRR